MERRKVQKVGGSTYTVSLPKDWAHEHHIEAGEDVHLYTHDDGSLVVRASRTDGEGLAERTVELGCEPPETIATVLRGLYAAGFDEITLTAPDGFGDAQRRQVTNVARDTVGLQVVAADEAAVTVRSLLDAADVSVQQSVLQLQFTALSLHRSAVETLVDGEDGSPTDLRERAAEVQRLAGMVVRHFNRSLSDFEETDALGVSRPDLFTHCRVAREYERLADEGVIVASVAESVERPLPDGFVDSFETLATDARTLLEDATELVLDGATVDEVTDLLGRTESLTAEQETVETALFETASDTDPRLLRALDSVARTAEGGRAVARAALGATTTGAGAASVGDVEDTGEVVDGESTP
ncbi:AbrB/MazE/SpoVT family DNA-binding domain-containing protein [Haloarchaeobius iranensis]|uniref:Phosphate uptake regulator n=1 Tax=Haloarchaeobius iranensis TaxID=996166 RepID=A0A1G9W0U0_9EURY|nr:AbrB/MazE/SpoVT family DNA-binding domain-containing protein [Haloarchaeobius iranensis]SDM77857.1 Phosphate uptake regulator [Haloarchaeobius iranensis]